MTLYSVMMESESSEFPSVCEMYNGYATTTTILSEARRECQEYRDIWPENRYWVAQITEAPE